MSLNCKARILERRWNGVRETLNCDGKAFAPDIVEKLSALDELLRPRDFLHKVKTILLSSRLDDADLEGMRNAQTTLVKEWSASKFGRW